MEQMSSLSSQVSIQTCGAVIVDLVERICSKFRVTSLDRQISACKTLFTESPDIDIAILGQFKAGKSSFINNLIGRDVLPVGVIPVTTVITRLHYGPREKAVITYFDGKTSQIELEAVDEYISELKNQANKKNVEVVDIELPSLEAYRGLRFVDTPGLGSVFKYNTEISEDWLPEVGCALVAISSDRPLSENDLNLIRELMDYTPRVVLLLSKVDLLSEEQQHEVVRFFKETLKREFNKDFQILTYSTVKKTQLYRHRLDKLLFSLSTNRDAEFRGISHHKIRSLARMCISYLDIALKTSMQNDADRQSLKDLILDERVSSELIEGELNLIAGENKHNTRTFIADYLEATQRAPLTQRLLSKLSSEMPTWKGNLWKLTRRYEEWLMETLTEEIDSVSKAQYKHFFGSLKKAQSSIVRSVALFRTVLDSNVEKVLGAKLNSPDWVIEVSEPSQPDVAFTKVFDFHLDLLWFLFPMVIFRGLFEKHFLKGIPRIAVIHISRLAYQWEVRINKTIDDIKDQALDYVRSELSTIDALLSQTTGQGDNIKAMLRDLEYNLAKLDGTATISIVEGSPGIATSARQPWFIKNNSKTNKIGIQMRTDKNTEEDTFL
ncbi:MAG: Bacterial dynamin-like protein [Syntrophorhabdus sp. PtaU1.Bin153]|nr:MAG: Bacterial dynamin-like protein [Syntrophorhabdus sp. PtaU1.Bin153]